MAHHQEKYFRQECIWSFYDGAQNIDEYFFTEAVLFYDDEVKDRTLRFAKQLIAKNYNSLYVLNTSRDGSMWNIVDIYSYISSIEFLHRLKRRSMPLLFLGFSIGPIVSFLETCVVIPANVTHREKGYHEGWLLQNNPSRGIDSAL